MGSVRRDLVVIAAMAALGAANCSMPTYTGRVELDKTNHRQRRKFKGYQKNKRNGKRRR